MRTRAIITGRLTKDAKNITTKDGQKRCFFDVAVNTGKDCPVYIACFLRYHLSDEQLSEYKEGCLCNFTGYLSENLKLDKNEKAHLNRTLDIKDFNHSREFGKYSEAVKIIFVGYVYQDAVIQNGETIFKVSEYPLYDDCDSNKHFEATINYKVNDKVLSSLKDGSMVFLFGYYKDKILPAPANTGVYIERFIQVADYEIIEKSTLSQNFKIGDLLTR